MTIKHCTVHNRNLKYSLSSIDYTVLINVYASQVDTPLKDNLQNEITLLKARHRKRSNQIIGEKE